MKRFNLSLASSLSTLGVLVAVGALLSFAAIGRSGSGAGDRVGVVTPGANADQLQGDQASGGDAGAAGGGSGDAGQQGSGAGGAGTGGQAGSNGAAPVPRGVACAAGKNGGATDVGVTGRGIKLASTIVLDGPGASFLAPVRVAMQAVAKKTNAGGGVCGRQFDLTLRNDSWDASTGARFIQNFVEGEKVFALAVVPSSEGLKAADSFIAEQKVPVVGTDGMLIHQYRNPWIWPVATPTISTMHVMAQDAYNRSKQCPTCTQSFGIVFDAKYHFGVEGAYAFDQAIKRLTGHDIDGFDPSDPEGSLKKNCAGRFCGIQPGQSSYSSEVRTFNSACGLSGGKACDFVAILLEPDTAVTWFAAGRQSNPQLDPHGAFGGAQPLFNRSFAEGCKTSCNGMWVWSGYNPPIESLASSPGVTQYINDVHAESSSTDVVNQFVEGGYQGMQLLVQALRKVGPILTRAALKQQLDSMTLDTGLSQPASWKAGDHFANVSARAFEIQYQASFGGWRGVTDFIRDPWVGLDSDIK